MQATIIVTPPASVIPKRRKPAQSSTIRVSLTQAELHSLIRDAEHDAREAGEQGLRVACGAVTHRLAYLRRRAALGGAY